MDNSTKNFLEFNGRSIYTMSADGISYVALKPICQALGLNWKYVHERLLLDEILGGVSRNIGIHDTTNRIQKMTCLPERYVYGWLFLLNSTSTELKEYKLKCYDLLYDHFHGAMTARLSELRVKSDAELLVEVLENEISKTEIFKQLQEAKATVAMHGKVLKKLDKDLQKGQSSLFGLSN